VKKASARMALCGMMTALGTAAMLLGGTIPLATFCCPVLAGMALLPVMAETGRKTALGAYVAIAALSLMLSTDKESALLFAFLGYYPVLKPTLDRIRNRALRTAAKLGVFDAAAGLMALLCIKVLNMEALATEYAAMSRAMLAAFILLANITMLLYDRALLLAMILYVRRIRPKLRFK